MIKSEHQKKQTDYAHTRHHINKILLIIHYHQLKRDQIRER